MTHRITVTGMQCSGCESTLRDTLGDFPGVEAVDADAYSDTVVLCGDPDLRAVRDIVASLGYGVEG